MEQVMRGLHADASETYHYIQQIDAVREACAKAGQYREAKACLDRIEDANVGFALLAQEHAGRFNIAEKKRLKEKHTLEDLETKRLWKEKLRDYNQDAGQLLVQLEREQLLEMQEVDAAFRASHQGCTQDNGDADDCVASPPALRALLQSDETLAEDPEPTAAKPRGGGHAKAKKQGRPAGAVVKAPGTDSSRRSTTLKKEVAKLREALERLVQSQRYEEADKTKRDLAKKEQELATCFEEEMKRDRQQCLQEAARRLREQRAAAETRMNEGRQRLMRERDLAMTEMAEAHRRARDELDAATALVKNAARQVLQEQLASYKADPARGNNFFIRALMGPSWVPTPAPATSSSASGPASGVTTKSTKDEPPLGLDMDGDDTLQEDEHLEGHHPRSLLNLKK